TTDDQLERPVIHQRRTCGMNGPDSRLTASTIHRSSIGDHDGASVGQILLVDLIDSPICVLPNPRMRRSTLVRCAIALTIFVGIVVPSAARADNASRIAELGQLLSTSSSAKARISAVAALSR